VSAICHLHPVLILGTTVTNRTFTQKEIKVKLTPDNIYFRSVQNFLSFRPLYKNLKIIIYKTVILPTVLYGCETWSLTLRKEHSLGVLRTGL
jgi:hypothetical protein